MQQQNNSSFTASVASHGPCLRFQSEEQELLQSVQCDLLVPNFVDKNILMQLIILDFSLVDLIWSKVWQCYLGLLLAL